MTCLLFVRIQTNLFPFYCFSSYSQIVMNWNIPPDSTYKCIAYPCVRVRVCVCIYQLLNDEYWKSILSVGESTLNLYAIMLHFALSVAKVHFRYVYLKHRKWHDIAAIENRFECCCAEYGAHTQPPSYPSTESNHFLYSFLLIISILSQCRLPNSLRYQEGWHYAGWQWLVK